MIKRLISGIVMLAILFPLVLIDNAICRILYSVLVTFLSAAGCYEYINAASKKCLDLESLNMFCQLYQEL